MVKKGYSVLFDSDVCQVLEGDEVIATAVLSGGVYRLNAKPVCEPLSKDDPQTVSDKQISSFASEQCEDEMLWHGRLGHLNRRSMKVLSENIATASLFSGDVTKAATCVPCAHGKLSRKPFVSKDRQPAK